jgi:hypothetical protein
MHTARIESSVIVGHSIAGVAMPDMVGRAPELYTLRIDSSGGFDKQMETVMQPTVHSQRISLTS